MTLPKMLTGSNIKKMKLKVPIKPTKYSIQEMDEFIFNGNDLAELKAQIIKK